MDEKEVQSFDLEDIMKEFGSEPEAPQEIPENAARNETETVSSDTVVLPDPQQLTAQKPVEEDTILVTELKEIPKPVTTDTVPLPNLEQVSAQPPVSGDTIVIPDLGQIAAQHTPVSDETVRLPQLPKTEKTAPVSTDTQRIPDVTKVGTPKEVTSDTVRLDDPRLTAEPDRKPQVDPFTATWEPEYEQPIGEYVPPQPIVFHPRSRLRELKKKLVAGPEKQYYSLSEKGLGKLQLAIFFSFVIVLLAAATTVVYALGMVPENRMKLMVFGQLLAMMLSALLGSFQLIEGVADLFKGRFTLNTLLVFTLIACLADGILCLEPSVTRIPCCAAFSLEMTMSLWSAYQNRHGRLGQLDTMRKANHLEGVCVQEDFYQGKKGFVRCEGQVEDFMDHYEETGKPEKRMGIYALIAMILCVGIGATSGALYGWRQGVQVVAVALLAAVPATAFITVSRPFAILTKKLHKVGAVLCGWKAVDALKGKAVFPVGYADLFPAGTVKLNGVKFYGSRQPDQVVEYTAAMVEADGSGVAPLFVQLLDSRNGRHYDVKNYRIYENGGIGGTVAGETVLVGSLSFLRDMGVKVPDSVPVNYALCVAVEGELEGLFALHFDVDRMAAAGMAALCGSRGLKPLLTTVDFMLTEELLRSRFGIKPKRLELPDVEQRRQLAQNAVQPEGTAQVLVTGEGLLPFAYGVAGARTLRSACNAGTIVHMIGGILGMGIIMTLTLLGALEYVDPAKMFAYQLLWIVPGLLITEWTRSI